MPSQHEAGKTLRDLLDYVVWSAGRLQQLGLHGGADAIQWRQRVQRAYVALFIPIVPGHGPPWPPDVPGPRNPGIWPDVPAASIPGMTLRHQLAAIEYRCGRLRDRPRPHMSPREALEWDRRLALARASLDHGDAVPLPAEARTEPSKAAIAEAEAQAQAHRRTVRQRQERLRAQMRRRQTRKTAPPKAGAKPKAKAAAKAKAAPKAKRPAAAVRKGPAKAPAKAKAKAVRKKK
jgi:hypothetical protein